MQMYTFDFLHFLHLITYPEESNVRKHGAEIKNHLSLWFKWTPRDEYKKEDTHMLVGKKFPLLPRKNDRVSSEIIHKNHNSLSPD